MSLALNELKLGAVHLNCTTSGKEFMDLACKTMK